MLDGLKNLIILKVSEHAARKAALEFAIDFIEHIYREQCRVTTREYQELLNELSKIEKVK